MILCPLQNTQTLKIQSKPVITQHFGENPALYKKFGWKGHEGLDFRAKIGTQIYSPIDGICQVIDSDKGYGMHVIVTNNRLRVILGHLSAFDVHHKQVVAMGDPIGKTGNSGNSSAPHLHLGVQRINGDVIKDKTNGYGGGVDVEEFLIYWYNGI